MKLKNIKRTYLALQIGIVALAVLALFAGSRIYPPTTDEALREVKIWTTVFIVSLMTIAALIVLLIYFKPKAKEIIQDSELLESGTKNMFEEGESDDQKEE